MYEYLICLVNWYDFSYHADINWQCYLYMAILYLICVNYTSSTVFVSIFAGGS